MQENTSTHGADSEVNELPHKQVVVANKNGLHARPAAILAKEAQSFEAAISLVSDDLEVDAKSILDILTLAASQGTTLQLRAVGDDAETALRSLDKLFKGRFGEER